MQCLQHGRAFVRFYSRSHVFRLLNACGTLEMLYDDAMHLIITHYLLTWTWYVKCKKPGRKMFGLYRLSQRFVPPPVSSFSEYMPSQMEKLDFIWPENDKLESYARLVNHAVAGGRVFSWSAQASTSAAAAAALWRTERSVGLDETARRKRSYQTVVCSWLRPVRHALSRRRIVPRRRHLGNRLRSRCELMGTNFQCPGCLLYNPQVAQKCTTGQSAIFRQPMEIFPTKISKFIAKGVLNNLWKFRWNIVICFKNYSFYDILFRISKFKITSKKRTVTCNVQCSTSLNSFFSHSTF